MSNSASFARGIRPGDLANSPPWRERSAPPSDSGDGEGSVDGRMDAGTLQFLHVSEPYHPPDKTHRRAVRQHVMRNFHDQRRKKKVQPVKKHKLEKKDGEDAETQLSTRRRTNVSKEPIQTTDSSLDLSAISAVLRDGSPSIGSTDVCRTAPTSNSFNQEEYEQSILEEGNVLLSEDAIEAVEECDSIINTMCIPHIDVQTFNIVSPYLLLQADDAPYLCLDAKRWPFPQRLGGASPKLSVWMPQMNEGPLNLRGPRPCLHRSLQILPYIENSPEYYEFKGNTIKWINDRLKCAENSLSDTTMGSIMLLTSFEASRGNVLECVHHLDGLQRIVDLRGGINEFTDKRHIQLKVLLLDMIVATLSNTIPRFSILKSPRPLLRPLNMPGSNTPRIYDSPLYSSGTLIDALDDSDFSTESIQTLQRLRDLTIFASRGLNIHTGVADLTSMAPDDYYLTTQSSDGGEIVYTAPSLDRVVKLTASIYLGAISNPPIPFASHQNWAAAQELCAAIESPANDATWDQFPGVLVWVLLTVAAAGKGFSGHSLLMSLLIRVGLGSGYGWWEEFSEMMFTFMKIKRKAEGMGPGF